MCSGLLALSLKQCTASAVLCQGCRTQSECRKSNTDPPKALGGEGGGAGGLHFSGGTWLYPGKHSDDNEGRQKAVAKERLTHLSDLNPCHWGQQINHFIQLLLQELLRAGGR